ncbi:MAG: type II toxin-antitoxin system VapC family toxin [Gammaproteobacteria bacterium]|nr:type II toxin-antitoxin system VapC family toxin [Gammaproteobacteria bacterium]MCY3687519.1 type II toxin-antitoxin system VapC family toxin [Gammaproteobacteria bacterium]MDE0478712.1 type II toxin-antitoxin system VapC family toxin [Gammaproteobacteria bacterium]MDE0508578.1 type II toxin-antitoxin system VapC family toxin [Gammaproteobacteria bacterium]
MRAIDTNIVIRYLTADDPDQTAKARAVVDAGQVFVSTTVLLECEWVLRSVYEFSRHDVIAALRAFLGLPGVATDNTAVLVRAFDFADNGMDFTDALHLSAASECELMFTFDRRFIKQAADAPIEVVAP